MDITVWMLIGFIFAVYAVTANDSVQTLGTYLSSNRDVKWYWMFAFMGSIFVATMSHGFSSGDPAFGRLTKFTYVEPQWYHALAPLVLVFLTRFKNTSIDHILGVISICIKCGYGKNVG